MFRMTCLALLAVLSPAQAQQMDPEAVNPVRVEFDPLTTEVGPGWVDWTAGLIHAIARGEPDAGAYAESTIVEQQARTGLGPVMVDTASRVQVDHEHTAADLLNADTPASRMLERNLPSSWHVVETRYYASGSIEVEGEISVLHWLKPALLPVAAGQIPKTKSTSRTTGVVLDARGIDLQPAVAPRVLDSIGNVLYTLANVAPAVVQKRLPVLYVTDPADPLANKRAGQNPLFLPVMGASDEVDLVLSANDGIRFRTVSQDPHLLSEGRIVVIASP